MNFLAHAYLSFGHPQVLLGNLISDFVKGKTPYSYPLKIPASIQLHRSIDSFTDAHSATKKAKEVFRPYYRLYSGALMDIIYDHFLATDKTIFEESDLLHFSTGVYYTLDQQSFYLPQRFVALFPYMKKENWLLNYGTMEGIERSLQGLVRRSAYLTDHKTAFHLLNINYSLLQDCYGNFIEDVKTHSKKQFEQLVL